LKLPLAVVLLLVVAALADCSGRKCGRTDWCACSGGTDCFQSCDDTDGCRFFCDHMSECGATCGAGCSFDFHDATAASASCGDSCHVVCHDNVSCGTICGANCEYTSFNTDRSGVRAGPNSMLNCINVKDCAVECLGACRVRCVDQVDHCEVTCPNGASPASCDDGSLACGGC
jgi:hypothetical protein